MKTLRRDISISLTAAGETTSEVRKLASTAGSEEDEIDEMIRADCIFAAKRKEKVVGFIALRSKKNSTLLEISGLAVKENERRRKLASLLLKHAEEFAVKHKAERIIARTSNDNIPALAFYQKNGFKIRGVRLGELIGHHGGKEVSGWADIPVRDEIVLEKNVSA